MNDPMPKEDSGFSDPELYDELKRIAAHYMRNEREEHTLQTTALVHEAWMRLDGRVGQKSDEDRGKFCAAAAVVMRRILIDHARKRKTHKRGGDAVKISLDDQLHGQSPHPNIDVLALDDALNRLATLNERHARVVELRFFGGMTIEETAKTLGISDYTVKSDWRVARAWLISELKQD